MKKKNKPTHTSSTYFITSEEWRKDHSDQAAILKTVIAELKANETDDGVRSVDVIISTGAVDRDNDTIDPKGWQLENYKNTPSILWAHDYSGLPIAKAVEIEIRDGALYAKAEFPAEGVYDFADTVYALISGGFIRASSVGFAPSEWRDAEDRKGTDFLKQELLEFSFVPVPSNPQALIQAKAAGIDMEPLRKWAEDVLAKSQSLQINIESSGKTPSDELSADQLESIRRHFTKSGIEITVHDDGFFKSPPPSHPDPIRWNKSLPKAFDVSRERFQPAKNEYALVSKYMDCEVKDLRRNDFTVPSAKIGSFLSALDERLSTVTVEDVRNFNWEDKECPPVYESIRLNSSTERTFLVEGIRFISSANADGKTISRFGLKLEPVWYGLDVTYYSNKNDETTSSDFIAETQKRAKEINFLKGEAFTLSGEFISRGAETWDDVFLEQKNEQSLKRCVDRINEHGAELEKRGVILMGDPGTGKTLSGRVMLNTAKCTFIWLSSRDFWYAGSFGGIAHAFDLAKECAPSILFIEDVDNWLDSHTCDLLKTEMDGLVQYKGVVTVLTTNYPQHFPKALIDRPGRFHDVLSIDLPSKEIRAKMLKRWLPDVSDADLAKIAADTQGYSGAHIRELARFAETIAVEDKIGLADALQKALERIKEQRELITQSQLSGSNYQPRKDISMAIRRKSMAKAGWIEIKTAQPTFADWSRIDYWEKFEKSEPTAKALDNDEKSKLTQMVELCGKMSDSMQAMMQMMQGMVSAGPQDENPMPEGQAAAAPKLAKEAEPEHADDCVLVVDDEEEDEVVVIDGLSVEAEETISLDPKDLDALDAMIKECVQQELMQVTGRLPD